MWAVTTSWLARNPRSRLEKNSMNDPVLKVLALKAAFKFRKDNFMAYNGLLDYFTNHKIKKAILHSKSAEVVESVCEQ